MSDEKRPPRTSRLIRWAVLCALGGLVCVSFFLWQDFSSLSIGVGLAVGIPLLVVAMVSYLFAILRELHHSGEL